MGRGMLFLVSGMFVIFGIIQLAVFDRQATIGEVNVDFFSQSQARNVANSGMERAFYRLATMNNWRTGSTTPHTFTFGADRAEVFVTDITPKIVEIRSQGFFNNTMMEVRSRLFIEGGFPPTDAAMGIFTENLDFNVAGSAFLISGNDQNPDGTVGPAGSLPGIAVNSAPAYNEIISSLNSTQQTRIQGEAPNAEAIQSIGGTVGANHPSLSYNPDMDPSFLENFIQTAMARADHVYNDHTASGVGSLGTPEDPKVIIVNGTLEVRNATGAGVIIVREGGSLDARGNFDNFQGLIIIQGTADLTRGNINILGAMLFGGDNPAIEIDIDFRGNVNVQYSSAALANAENRLFSSGQKKHTILTYLE